MAEIQVVRAVVHVTVPIVCSSCGIKSVSQPIKVKQSHLSLDDLATVLRGVRLGTHFPVGWAKFYRREGDILKCPACVHKPTDSRQNA